MTKAYVTPKAIYSLAVMGSYLSLIDQDLPAQSDPLKILYAQRIGFFPTMAVTDGQTMIDKINADSALATIPLEGFLNGLIKNRLLVQARTMVRNIEDRYTRWYQRDKSKDRSTLSTSIDNRSAVYLPNAVVISALAKIVEGTYNGSYLKTRDIQTSPYAERMNDVRNEYEILCTATGQLPRSPFASSKFFPLMSSLMDILVSAVENTDEHYRYRMVPIVRTIFILCRMFNGDIKEMDFSSIYGTTSCDDGLFISDTTLAIMNGCTSEVIRSLGIHERTQISRRGQFYLTACDCFVSERATLADY